MGRSPHQQGRFRSRLRSKILAVGVAAACALVATACGSGGGSSSAGTTPVSGGTAVYALPPAETPNYIFPFTSSAYISEPNIWYLQSLLYRPLYWFGENGQPTVNNSLSLANPPKFSGTKVTVTLKHYMWSNGTQVTAQDVMFWLNMEKAEPADYGAYTGFPTNVKDITVVSPTELTMVMDKAYSPTWFQYNDLSQITPMPAAWDRTASGPSHCDTTVSDCPAVYNYLNDQAKNLTGYVGSPLWSIVDGPWRLSAFNADGHITFVPNKSYSGPVKPKLSAFQEVPFTTDSAEYDVLRAPSSSTKIDVGYLPSQDAPAKPANAAVGANPVPGYTLSPLYEWGIAFYVVNFQSTVSDHAAIIKQLYFRQALAYLMNQAAVISGPLRGYGTPTVGPVANTPVTSFLSSTGKAGDPFPYNPGKAKSLLTSHGWKVVPNGVSTCVDPSRCGPGITNGTGLSFNFPYATGLAWVTSEMTQLQSNAAALGIKLNLAPEPFNQVTALAGGNCVVAKIPCNWDMANWGGGWSFAPDFLPTGETLFKCGAVANSGGYCDPANDTMINKTLTSANLQYMYTWQDYLAPRLPLMWQPNGAYSLTEIADNLKGVTPQSPTLSINPENWYFTK
jgi:peptide/nickel transport system substrate-binding protein